MKARCAMQAPGVAEKFGRGKLGFGGGETSGLPLLQALETLAIGITGTPPLGGTQGGSATGVSSPANRLRSLGATGSEKSNRWKRNGSLPRGKLFQRCNFPTEIETDQTEKAAANSWI